jgi:hypothetical protein
MTAMTMLVLSKLAIVGLEKDVKHLVDQSSEIALNLRPCEVGVIFRFWKDIQLPFL